MKYMRVGVAILVLGILTGAGTSQATTQQTQTAAVATQTAAVTQTSGAATATALAAGTQTALPTPTNNAGLVAQQRRVLNDMQGAPGAPPLGDIIQALWSARQIGGALAANTTGVDIAAGSYAVTGVNITKAAATAQAITACGNTDFQSYLKCTLCINPAGTYTFRPGTAALTQELALKPNCAHNEVEVAYIQIPPSFTSGTSTVTAFMLKQDPTLRDTTAALGQK